MPTLIRYVTRRRVKIDLAKQRIAEARSRLRNRVGEASVDSSASVQNVQEQAKANPGPSHKPNTSLDAEDLLIERLVLLGVNIFHLVSSISDSFIHFINICRFSNSFIRSWVYRISVKTP